MNIDLARPADIDALVGLRLAYLEADHGVIDADVAEAVAAALPDYFRAHLSRDLFGFVAREGDAIAACALLLVVEKPPSPAFPNGKTGTVLNVYTRPEYRRRGLGRAVMRRLLDHARAADICVVNLLATDDGYPLYRLLGFVDDADRYHPMNIRP